jgi:hypothetical protein
VNIRGAQTVAAPRAAVFAAICDPDVLLRVIPGCSEIARTGDNQYRGRIALRLPGIVGTYATVVRLVDAEAPSTGRLEGEVEGALGTIRGNATFRLSGSGSGTTIVYDGHAVIGGPLARLDSRFVEGIVGSLVAQGLRNLDVSLQHGAAEGPTADATRHEDEVPA